MKSTHKKTRLLLFFVCLILTFLLVGCEELTKVSVEERINSFINDLNAGKTSTLKGDHISPNSNAYPGIDAAYWDDVGNVWNPGNRPFQILSSSIPDGSTVSVQLTHANAGTLTWDFYMDETDEDFWLIKGVEGQFGP